MREVVITKRINEEAISWLQGILGKRVNLTFVSDTLNHNNSMMSFYSTRLWNVYSSQIILSSFSVPHQETIENRLLMSSLLHNDDDYGEYNSFNINKIDEEELKNNSKKHYFYLNFTERDNPPY